MVVQNLSYFQLHDDVINNVINNIVHSHDHAPMVHLHTKFDDYTFNCCRVIKKIVLISFIYL